MSGNSIDIVISIILIYGIIKGFYRGLFLEISSLIGLILGLYCAINFNPIISKYLKEFISIQENYISIISFIITLIIVVILLNLIAKSLTKLADAISLGLLNKITGAFFGLIKYFIVCMVFVLVFDKINSTVKIVDELTILSSIFYPYIRYINQELFPVF